MRRILISVVAGVALSACGCRPATEQQYTPSQQVAAFAPELQAKILAELIKHCGAAQSPKMLGDPTINVDHLRLGAAVFERRCAPCHGATGDGAGPAAEYLYPRPRDYRRGIFKFTSTPYGAKPRREDILRTVRQGARGTSMPEFSLLPTHELEAVVDYVLVLTHRGELEFQLALEAEEDDDISEEKTPELIDQIVSQWRLAQDQVVLPVTNMPRSTPESIEKGKRAFMSDVAGCVKCHGEDGRGLTQENAKGFTDSWNFPTRAADLTAGMFHGGNRPIDIYRRIYSGINGTPMPGFKEKLAEQPEEFWNLVHFVQSVSGTRRQALAEQAASRGQSLADATTPPSKALRTRPTTDSASSDAAPSAVD